SRDWSSDVCSSDLLPAVLGMAATLDELGQSMEKSSTAIGQFLVDMGVDTPKYAKLAGMSVKDFSALLKRDANEAFLLVLEKSKSAGGGLEALASAMADLEVKNSGSIAAIGALANNVDKLRAKQELANTEFDAGTSIMDEFDTVNTNLAANLEKIGNRLSRVWENGLMRDWLTSFTRLLAGSVTDTDRLTASLEHQEKQFLNLEKEINRLLPRHEELKGKTKLSHEEQEELRSVLDQITTLLPTSANKWNEFGEVIDINRVKVMAMTEAQREALRLKKE